MSKNTMDIETVRQIDELAKSLGGLAESKRLGFNLEDEKGIMSLSPAGTDYIQYVRARGLAECKRLGFILEDEHGMMSLSTAGLGYLLHLRAGGVTSPAETFAAGYQCAHGGIKAKG